VSTIYVRLADSSDTVYFQALFGTYSHLAWVRTEDPEKGITKVISTPDLVDEARRVLGYLKEEIEFEEVPPPE